jgi:hypothetical protein
MIVCVVAAADDSVLFAETDYILKITFKWKK